MRRLRFTATLYAALQAHFSMPARKRRARFYERSRAGTHPSLLMALAAASMGPETVPEWAFTPEMRASVLEQ